MADGLVHAKGRERAEVRKIWERYLNGLYPSEDQPTDELPVSYRGLADVAAMLSWLGRDSDPVVLALRDLIGSYNSLREQVNPIRADHETVKQARRQIDALRQALDQSLGAEETD